MSARLCLIEDDVLIAKSLESFLTKKGYQVTTMTDAASLDLNQNFDLYILDLLLWDGLSGYDVCKKIRAKSSLVPILILSALSEPQNRIEGLKVGADDYLTKPFEIEELSLRVSGMLKRASWYQDSLVEKSIFEWDNNKVNFLNFEGKKGKKNFSLNYKECMILKLLVQKRNQIVTRDEILNQIWGAQSFPTSRTVDNFIVKLRKYFEEDPQHPKHIHSIRGAGYKFSEGNA
jgi:two-component system alkaline phosphatase synthesis response regulator PhoP